MTNSPTASRFERTGFWAEIPMFESMSDGALRQLRSSLERVTFADGQTIIRQGDPGDKMYLLASGKVRVSIANTSAETRFERTLVAPAVFGEMALVTHEPRNATVSAATEVVCMTIDRAAFDDLVMRQPKVASFLTRAVGERLKEADSIRTVGKYEIVGQLGSGSVATVFEAKHPDLGRTVALKMLSHSLVSHQGFREHFATEGRLVAQLNHPNIVNVLDTEAAYGTLFIVMEKLHGAMLADTIKRNALPSWQAIRKVILETAQALACSHAQGLIHRDVKPSNVFLTEQGRAKLLDFGIAVQQDRSATGHQRVGTPYYMSPEQIHGRLLDGRSDLYALGIMAYELICGVVPFRSKTLEDLLRQHILNPLPDPWESVPDAPADLVEFVYRATAKRPEERYASCAEAAALLQQAAELPEVQRYGLTSVGVSLAPEHQPQVKEAITTLREQMGAVEGIACVESWNHSTHVTLAISCHPSRHNVVQGVLDSLKEKLSGLAGVEISSHSKS